MARTPPPRRTKKKGDKDRIPGQRKVKTSIRAIIREIVEDNDTTVRQAVLKGLKADPRTSHHFIKLAAEYIDGKPDQTLRHQFDMDEVAAAKEGLTAKLDAILEKLK